MPHGSSMPAALEASRVEEDLSVTATAGRARRPGRRALAALFATLQITVAAAVPGAVAATETTTTVNVGVVPCEGEIPLCNPGQHFTVTTGGTLRAEVTADAGNCTDITVLLSVDGAIGFTSEPVAPNGSTGVADLGPVSPGTHTLSVEAELPDSACDVRGWAGTLTITTAGVAASDVAVVAPGASATVSTAVSGSPRPAGITATLYRSASATTSATISVATYVGLPSEGPSPPPIRAAAYLDLQLTNAAGGDRIDGEFLPPNPVFPNDPIFPTDPLIPTDPLLPPNPIRLAYWSGASWDAVYGSGGALPTYSSAANLFTVTFDATSTPAVSALGGTVFAAVPGYYFRGFGMPVDSGALNVAKPGRAIPLKWQVFDFAVAPVVDLDPAVVAIASVRIPCEGTGLPSDGVEEYAAGGSRLQNLGDGVYQINWATSKQHAGTCRRLLLDLGERNPDGTPFHRTADFSFTR